MKKLSIVICSLPRRYAKLEKLLDSLVPQISAEVELIIMSSDTTQVDKLNRALEICTGEYFCIIDDDDYVTRGFVADILEHTDGKNDMIGYDIYSDLVDLNEHTDGQKPWRFLHHTYKTSLMKKFPPTKGMWDPEYVYSLDVKTWAWVPEQIYIYQFDPADNSQTGHNAIS